VESTVESRCDKVWFGRRRMGKVSPLKIIVYFSAATHAPKRMAYLELGVCMVKKFSRTTMTIRLQAAYGKKARVSSLHMLHGN
jgi:hypothetical protein